MSESTENLALPYIMPSQAQKHVTHNEAIRMLDALVQLSVLNDVETEPPAEPQVGARYIIGASPTGDWAGKQDYIAAWQDGNWAYFAPQMGWIAYVALRDQLVAYNGESWAQVSADATGEAPLFGINTSADSSNRLAAKTDAVLFSHDDVTPGTGDVRFTINKALTENTASLMFQSGWSSRAEMGLAGDDNLALKVSDDGANWQTAMRVDTSTGKPDFPALNLLEGFSLNLYPDAGRFDGGDGSITTANTNFIWPNYLQLYGGATAVSAGKFIHGNSTYGGSGGALTQTVDNLISKIRSPSYRRYGVEFHVAEIKSGDGDAYPQTFEGESLPLAMFCQQRPQPPKYTFHIYACTIDGPLGIYVLDGQTIIRDGVRIDAQRSTLIAPEDGWVSLAVQSEVDPYYAFGYLPYPMGLYAANGVRWQIACPALMGGLTKVDPNIGVIAPIGGW